MKIIDRQKVVRLRRLGMTISEIHMIVPVSKSSISLWIQNIKLSPKENKRIQDKITIGQLKSRNVLRQKALLRKSEIDSFSKALFANLKLTRELKIVLCSCLYEGEGGKGINQSLSFTNSDPKLIRIFLSLLRDSFDINENKFSACVHLHSYHNKDKQLKFWSKITKIPLSQFIKPFMKKNSGLYKKEGYEGCISIRYYDISIKRKLMTVFRELGTNL